MNYQNYKLKNITPCFLRKSDDQNSSNAENIVIIGVV